MAQQDMLAAAHAAVKAALGKGAQEAAARTYRVREVEVKWRDGRLEQIHEATTRGLGLALYVDGRFSSVSTSDLRPEALDTFIGDSVVLTRALDEAVELSNTYGPEHLCLAVQNPWAWSEKVMSAGGIFMGEYSFEVLGDYVAGPSHVMPTGGTARFASPLNVWDFVRIISLVGLNETAGRELSKSAAVIARTEGLEAHARSADQRTSL